MPVSTITNLTVRYGTKTAVSDLSVTVRDIAGVTPDGVPYYNFRTPDIPLHSFGFLGVGRS